jgi:integral membrane protein
MTSQSSRSIFSSPQKAFQTFAFGEALTWSLLLGGLAFRALVGLPPALFAFIGGLHGAMFLGYAVMAALVGVNQRWGIGRIVLGVVLAIVPFATIPFDRNLENKSLLGGAWRLQATADPRDNSWFDRLFRWFLNRPFLLAATLIVVVAAIFATLLTLGPPTEWGKN